MNDPQTNLVHELVSTTTESAVVGGNVMTRTENSECRTYATTTTTATTTPVHTQVTTTDTRWTPTSLQNGGNAAFLSQCFNQQFADHPFLNYKPVHLANPNTVATYQLEALLNRSAVPPANHACMNLTSLPPSNPDYFAYLATEQFPNFTLARLDMCLPNLSPVEPMEVVPTPPANNQPDPACVCHQACRQACRQECHCHLNVSQGTQVGITLAEQQKEDDRKSLQNELKEYLLDEASKLLAKKDEMKIPKTPVFRKKRVHYAKSVS